MAFFVKSIQRFFSGSITQYLEENIVNPVDGEASPVASPVAFHLRDLHAVAIVALEVIKIRGIFAQSTS